MGRHEQTIAVTVDAKRLAADLVYASPTIIGTLLFAAVGYPFGIAVFIAASLNITAAALYVLGFAAYRRYINDMEVEQP